MEEASCVAFDFKVDVALAVICVVAVAVSLLYSLFGYRCFRATLFATGFLFATLLVYCVCVEEAVMSTEANAGVSVTAGVIFGLITMLVHYVGLFVLGLSAGTVTAIVLVMLIKMAAPFGSMWAIVGIVFGVGLLAGLASLFWQKAGCIISSSIFGGALMAAAIDYFVEQFLAVKLLWESAGWETVTGPGGGNQTAEHDVAGGGGHPGSVGDAPCWLTWAVVTVWPVIAVIGITFQWSFSARGFDHRKVVNRLPHHSRKRRNRRGDMTVTRRGAAGGDNDKGASQPHQHKYRYLHQARRVNGDVISQSFMDTLQRGQSMSTLQSPDSNTISRRGIPSSSPPQSPSSSSSRRGPIGQTQLKSSDSADTTLSRVT